LQFGKVDPENLNPTWNMTRQIDNQNPVAAIENRLRTGSLAEGLENIRPKTYLYQLLKALLKKYRKIQEAGGWQTIPEGPTLKPGMTDPRIALLRNRLAITGEYEGYRR
jgi:murein L,D-transpeptidase YcbB/YkuD